MLSEDEKAKIHLEEVYRSEVRKQLEQKPKRQHKLWTFLNSTFGLWLLTAILITWAGTVYTQWQNRRAEEQSKQERLRLEQLKEDELIERLDLEIGYRFSQVQLQLASLTNWLQRTTATPRPELLPGKSEKDVKAILDSLSQSPKDRFPVLYEDFSNLSTLALIAELRRHVTLKERDEFDQVLAHLSGRYVHLQVEKKELSDVYAVSEVIFNDLTLPRWKTKYFYLSDCIFC